MKHKIYYLHNGDNIPFYIGKTNNLKVRLANHRKKYKDADIEVISEVKDWKRWERYYIKKYTNLGYNLLNGNKGGGGPNAGRPHTWGNKISKSLKGKLPNWLNPNEIAERRERMLGKQHVLNYKYTEKQLENVIDGKRKHINQYTEEGDMIKTWYATLTEIANEFNNKSSSTLNQHMRGKLKHAYGFIWSLA